MSSVESAQVRFGPYLFDAATGELKKNGYVFALRPQSANVLQYLTAHPGELVRREDLRDVLWAAGTYVDFEHGLNLCIHEIRAALHDDVNCPRYVQTLPRRGYRFLAPVEAEVLTSVT